MIFDEFLKLKGIFGILGIDIWVLIKIIWKYGIMKVCLINEGNFIYEVLENF